MQIVSKFHNNISIYGWMNTVSMGFRSIIHRLFDFYWQRYILFEREISADLDYGYDFSKYDLRQVTIADFDNNLWKSSFLTAEKQELYKKRFANPRDECIGLFIDNQLACIGWNHYDELFVYGHYYIKTKPKSFYMYDDFCIQDYRRQGLHKIVNAFRMYVGAHKGMTKAYVAIATYNRPSLNNYRRAGFKEVKRFVVTERGDNICCTLKSI